MAAFWYCIYGNLQILILVGCGYLVKSYWIQYAKPKPHLGFLEKLRYLSNTTLDFKSLPNANSAQKQFFRVIFGGHSPRYSWSYYFWLTIVELNKIVEITCHMLVFECKFLPVFLPVKQSILSISWKKRTLKFLGKMSSFSS